MVAQNSDNSESIAQAPSRNIDELKRLVITALDKNGVLSELRSTVKLHVTRAINEEQHSPLVHPRGAKMGKLMATDRGQLLTELIVDFLRFYDLKDTLSMFQVEGNLSRLRPSEVELASQCGFTYVPTAGISVIEQYLSKPTTTNFVQHGSDSSPLRSDMVLEEPERVGGTGLPGEKDIEELDNRLIRSKGLDLSNDSNNSSGIGGGNPNTSMENDMLQFKRISNEIDRISTYGKNGATFETDGIDSPRYEDDFDDSPIDLGKIDLSPLPNPSNRSRDSRGSSATSFSNPIDDNVLFESRESFKDLGEFPARKHPMELNDHIESVDRSPK